MKEHLVNPKPGDRVLITVADLGGLVVTGIAGKLLPDGTIEVYREAVPSKGWNPECVEPAQVIKVVVPISEALPSRDQDSPGALPKGTPFTVGDSSWEDCEAAEPEVEPGTEAEVLGRLGGVYIAIEVLDNSRPDKGPVYGQTFAIDYDHIEIEPEVRSSLRLCPPKRAFRIAPREKASNQAWARARGKCEQCGRSAAAASLTLHHRTYARLGCEKSKDLTVLCWTCHQKAHRSDGDYFADPEQESAWLEYSLQEIDRRMSREG